MALVKKNTAGTTSHQDTAAAKNVDTEMQTANTAEVVNTAEVTQNPNQTVAEATAEAKAKIAEEEAQYAAEDAAKLAEQEAAEKSMAAAKLAEEASEKSMAEAAKTAKKRKDDLAKKLAEEAAEKPEQEKVTETAAEMEARIRAELLASMKTETKTETNIKGTPVNTEKEINPVVEKEIVETTKVVEPEIVVETKTEVAQVKRSSMPANVAENAAGQDFGGIELGYGSFPTIKLPGEGVFCDSDDNELGKHIRATLQQSKAVYLYKQEDNDSGPVGYSYDGVNLSAYKGDEDYKTVAELTEGWRVEGYEVELRKYLEVVAIVCEGHDEIIGGEVPDGLEDLEGEPVIFSIPPSSVKAFSGKIATLGWTQTPIKGTKMDFKVNKKRKVGTNSYFPWKFSLVKNK